MCYVINETLMTAAATRHTCRATRLDTSTQNSSSTVWRMRYRTQTHPDTISYTESFRVKQAANKILLLINNWQTCPANKTSNMHKLFPIAVAILSDIYLSDSLFMCWHPRFCCHSNECATICSLVVSPRCFVALCR